MLDRTGRAVSRRNLYADGGHCSGARVRHEGLSLSAALREAQQNYRALVDLSPDAIAVHTDGKYVFVNPAAVHCSVQRDRKILSGERCSAWSTRKIARRLPPACACRWRMAGPQWTGSCAFFAWMAGPWTWNRPAPASSSWAVRPCSLSFAILPRSSGSMRLRQSEERYRIVANFTYDWEFWITPDGRCRDISPRRLNASPAARPVAAPWPRSSFVSSFIRGSGSAADTFAGRSLRLLHRGNGVSDCAPRRPGALASPRLSAHQRR